MKRRLVIFWTIIFTFLHPFNECRVYHRQMLCFMELKTCMSAKLGELTCAAGVLLWNRCKILTLQFRSISPLTLNTRWHCFCLPVMNVWHTWQEWYYLKLCLKRIKVFIKFDEMCSSTKFSCSFQPIFENQLCIAGIKTNHVYFLSRIVSYTEDGTPSITIYLVANRAIPKGWLKAIFLETRLWKIKQ